VSNARIQKTNFIISGLALVCNAQVARRQHAGNTHATSIGNEAVSASQHNARYEGV